MIERTLPELLFASTIDYPELGECISFDIPRQRLDVVNKTSFELIHILVLKDFRPDDHVVYRLWLKKNPVNKTTDRAIANGSE